MSKNFLEGIHSFQAGYFKSNQALFEKLATEGQNPETLFITCSDSRVVPNLITQAAPGDLFIVRNVGNVVPRPSLPGGTAAAIEYAIEVLGVHDVIICGHTQCGAMDAVLNPEKMASLPMVKRWLKETDQVRLTIEERHADLSPEERLRAAVEVNVLAQLDHLREYDFVTKRLDAGTLQVSGWVFDIKTGQVSAFDPENEQFSSLARTQARP